MDNNAIIQLAQESATRWLDLRETHKFKYKTSEINVNFIFQTTDTTVVDGRSIFMGQIFAIYGRTLIVNNDRIFKFPKTRFPRDFIPPFVETARSLGFRIVDDLSSKQVGSICALLSNIALSPARRIQVKCANRINQTGALQGSFPYIDSNSNLVRKARINNILMHHGEMKLAIVKDQQLLHFFSDPDEAVLALLECKNKNCTLLEF